MIRTDQIFHLSDIIDNFRNPKCGKIPNLVKQLNIYLDEDAVLRVLGKFKEWRANKNLNHPILLVRNSHLTNLIVNHIHQKCNHAGLYTILSQFRKCFFVPKVYSSVEQVLKSCLVFRRYNARTIKLNQSDNRGFAWEPTWNSVYVYILR